MKIQPNMSESAGNGRNAGSSSASIAATESRSPMSREFHNFVADVEDIVTGTTSITAEDLVRVKTKLGERVAAVKEQFADAGDTVILRARRAAAVTDDYVREQPWVAVGICAAAGLVLGFALGRRK